MSVHEEVVSDAGYDTPVPVPELDDHRHQSASVQIIERPRRGTFDSLYGGLDQQGARSDNLIPAVRVRHFDEEAILDEEGGDLPPQAHRGRRPTIETMDERGVSPPNSVKAFAEARRREREMSCSADRRPDSAELQRTTSATSHQSRRSRSRRSFRSRPHSAVDVAAASLVANKTAEDDVCFPVQCRRRNDDLHIDFDFLETFIREEREARAANRGPPGEAAARSHTHKVIVDGDVLETATREEREDRAASRGPSEGRVFSDMRPPSEAAARMHTPMVTVDGDFLEVPWDLSMKNDVEEAAVEEKAEPAKAPQQYGEANRFSFFSSAWESTIHAAELGDLVLPGEDVRGLFSFPEGEAGGVWWLNMNSPSEEEVRAICRAFGIHPLTIEDITTQEAREKIELFPSYYFASFRSFSIELDDGEQEYEPFNIYVVVFGEGTLSFSFAPNAHASHTRKRIAMLKDYVALSSDWICYALIDDIVDSFAPVIHRIELDTEMIEDEVFVARTDDMHVFLRKIGNLRKGVMGLMRLLGGKADVLRGFTKRCNENYRVTPHMDIGLYLGDIQDHVVTMMTNLGQFEKMLSRSHSNYLAQLSINSITQGTSTNRVLSKITLLASIIVPLNVITGLFGMNVEVPFRAVNNLVPFFLIVGTLLMFCVTALVVSRRKRWI